MNILFLTLVKIDSIAAHDIYTDLMREFIKNGHQVYIVSPNERRTGLPTRLLSEENCSILQVKIGNTQKTNIIEKGISTVLLEGQYKRAIRKYLKGVCFDLVLYSTPPITLTGVIEWVKKRDNAKSYLLLKDIFPQNAVDLGMLSTGGVKGLIYRFFRYKEKKLYALSDRIGCMSQANVDYVLGHNPEIDPAKTEICPNCVEVRDLRIDEDERLSIRRKYGIPTDKKVFVYGGNLGKPQGIPFIIDCLKTQADNENAFFLLVGDGTEYPVLERFFTKANHDVMRLMRSLPKEDYDRLVAACDVGMIFLDHRFTIPNFPSRLLSYMQVGLPVLACTDPNTDVGKVIVEGGFGWWCESNDASKFKLLVDEIYKLPNDELFRMGECGCVYMKENYDADLAYKTIVEKFGKQENLSVTMSY